MNVNGNTSGVLFSNASTACFIPVTEVVIGGFSIVWSGVNVLNFLSLSGNVEKRVFSFFIRLV